MTESVSSKLLTVQEIASNNAQEAQAKKDAEQKLYDESIFGKVDKFTGIDMKNAGSNFDVFESGKSTSTELGELGTGVGQVLTSPITMTGNILSGAFSVVGGILSPVLGFTGKLLGGSSSTSNQSSSGKSTGNSGSTGGSQSSGQSGTQITVPAGSTITINGQKITIGSATGNGTSGTSTGSSTGSSSASSSSTGSSGTSTGSTSSAKTGSSASSSVDNLKSGSANSESVSNLSRGLEKTSSSVRAAVEELNEADSDVASAKDEMESLASAASESLKSKDALSSAYVQQQEAQSQADYYGGKVSSMKADLASEKAILKDLESVPAKDRDNARITQTKNSISRFEQEIEKLTAAKNKAETQVATLKTQVDKMSDEDKKNQEAVAKYKAAETKYNAALQVQKDAQSAVKSAVKDVTGGKSVEDYVATVGQDGLQAETAKTEKEVKTANAAEKTAKEQKTYDNTLSFKAKQAVLTGNTSCPSDITSKEDKAAWQHAVELAQIEQKQTSETQQPDKKKTASPTDSNENNNISADATDPDGALTQNGFLPGEEMSSDATPTGGTVTVTTEDGKKVEAKVPDNPQVADEGNSDPMENMRHELWG